MERQIDFEEIRPYNDHEVNDVMQRLVENPSFFNLMRYVYPDDSKETVISKVQYFSSIREFQEKIAHPAMRKVINSTTKSLTFDGIDNLHPPKNRLFISNHRDIILDSAILNVVLFENGFDTTETAIGNNLLSEEIITDLTKLNKNFVVKRNTSQREFYENSVKLSAYIHHGIRERGVSIWIAQKEGRTKDGKDKTQPGLLKMLGINCEDPLRDCLKHLNITPVTVSYEFDPCDILKIRELKAIIDDVKYEKQEGEDFNSIITGITGNKGRVHLSIGKAIGGELEKLADISNVNEKIRIIGTMIDQQIYSNYKLWPTNYIAADLLRQSDEYKEHYSNEEFDYFEKYVSERLKAHNLKEKRDRELLLTMYANPVSNCHE